MMRWFVLIVCVGAVVALWAGAVLAPVATHYDMVLIRLNGESYIALRQCFITCEIMGYRYPYTPEGKKQAREKLSVFQEPEAEVIMVIRQ